MIHYEGNHKETFFLNFRLLFLNTWFCAGIISGEYPLEEGPLSQMSEAVNNIDKVDPQGGGVGNMGPHTPCTPHTPGMPATPHTPGTGHKSPRNGTNR